MRIARSWLIVSNVIVTLAWFINACSTAAPNSPTAVIVSEPTITSPSSPTAALVIPSATTISTTTLTAILQPYPYTTPLPLPTPTILDGVYQRVVPDRGTPVPCRRCAPYKAEGGSWTLRLTAGAFRVSHQITNFQGVGSFIVTGDRITFFNDPNCYDEVGVYRWQLDGQSLVLEEVVDPCAFGLRANNLTAGRWVATEQQGQQLDPCLPPNIEAAVTGHWLAPSECNSSEVAQSE